MPRPKPPAPLVGFHVKLPPNEADAIASIVSKWSEEIAARLAGQGIHVPPPADRTAWFRHMLREQAARYGVAIASVDAPEAPPPAAPRPKPSKKR